MEKAMLLYNKNTGHIKRNENSTLLRKKYIPEIKILKERFYFKLCAHVGVDEGGDCLHEHSAHRGQKRAFLELE